jgi:hypothetical protein
VVGGGSADDFADDLMAGDEGLVEEREVAFEDVEIGAAYSAGEDAENEMAVGKDGNRNDFELKRGLPRR